MTTPEQKIAGMAAVTTLPRGKNAERRGQQIRRLTLLTIDDALRSPPRAYLVKGIAALGETAVIYGAPANGKTFLALHLAYAVAQGRPFFGRRVTHAPVLYFALEGEGGLRNRLAALHWEYGEAPEFCYIAETLPLGSDPSFVDDVIAAVRATGARLVVIDTLARAMAGLDENSAADMGKVVAMLDAIRNATGATVLAVHHSGKDETRGARGSNALLAGVSVEIHVSATDVGARTWKVTRAKDDPCGDACAFTLRPVPLGNDDDGDPITTCLVDEGEAVTARQRARLAPQQAKALAHLYESIVAIGTDLPTGHSFPRPPAQGCRIDAWRDECARRGLFGSDNPDSRKRTFRDVKTALKSCGRIAEYDGWVWLLPEAQR